MTNVLLTATSRSLTAAILILIQQLLLLLLATVCHVLIACTFSYIVRR